MGKILKFVCKYYRENKCKFCLFQIWGGYNPVAAGSNEDEEEANQSPMLTEVKKKFFNTLHYN
jgi:hypothetical protein